MATTWVFVWRSQAQPPPTMDISWQGRYTDNLHISDEQRITDFREPVPASPGTVIHAIAQISASPNCRAVGAQSTSSIGVCVRHRDRLGTRGEVCLVWLVWVGNDGGHTAPKDMGRRRCGSCRLKVGYRGSSGLST